MKHPDRRHSAADRELGLDRPITRRDFVNSAAIGTGAALLWQHAPLFAQKAAPEATRPRGAAFNGYSGVGDYARSNGNTWEVVQSAHAMRDGAYRTSSGVVDTEEFYDVVVVGGGFAGMGAARRVLGEDGRRCLVLENHPMFGGEAKRNEFEVEGVRLMAPQGSNECVIPEADETSASYRIWTDLGLPREVTYSELPASGKPLQSSRTNYIFHLWADTFESHGFYFPEEKRWVTNPWGHALAGVPWSDEIKRDMLRWRQDRTRYAPDGLQGPELERWLDSMSYEHYLTEVMGLGVEPARYADDILAAAGGLGSDVTSARMAWGFSMPGFQGMQDEHSADNGYRLSALNNKLHRFPGGNDAILRAFVKRLVPAAFAGDNFADVHNEAVRFEALDRPGQPVRIRLGATVVAVEHERRDGANGVAVTYERGGRLYRVRARGAVMAGGCWTAKRVVRDLPQAHARAMARFHRSPILVVNVALNNWRALYKLGYTAASWRGGLGFSFNLSPPMQVGGYAPAFDPDKPAVLTSYVPFPKVGLPIEQQGALGRTEMLSTSYREYERKVRMQLTEMLAGYGFDARRDIAGIILNRWGHAYVNAYPGFYFGQDGESAPRDIVRQPFGRIAFGHSELRGFQYWWGGVEEGRRAAEQVLDAVS